MEKDLKNWKNVGYERVSVVQAAGQFSQRGGIVDIFPPSLSYPIRIELFGDEIDTMRYFDPATQRTLARRAGKAPGPHRGILPAAMRHPGRSRDPRRPFGRARPLLGALVLSPALRRLTQLPLPRVPWLPVVALMATLWLPAHALAQDAAPAANGTATAPATPEPPPIHPSSDDCTPKLPSTVTFELGVKRSPAWPSATVM